MRDDCGGDCGSCARCADRLRQEEADFYQRLDDETRAQAEEQAYYESLDAEKEPA